MNEILNNVLTNTPLGIFSFFILGLLLIIFIQNIFFYINYKDRPYLWYAIYAFIILCDQIIISYDRYLINTESVYRELVFFKPIHPALEWLYNSAYLIFVVEFGGLYLFREKTAKKIKKTVYLLTLTLVVFYAIDIFFDNNLVRKGFLLVQVPMLVILSVIIYYHLFQMKTTIKKYIIPGSLAFSIFSLLALGSSLINPENPKFAWSFFYIGVFIENIFFSLGLVVKQKFVLKERNDSQHELILKLRENEILKNALSNKLQEEVKKQTTEIIKLNEEAEAEKIKKLEITFEKKIIDLKVSSLQSQMNPHFIFNSLNSIKLYIIKNEKENAVYYLNKFSKLIRKILAASREVEVSLQEELETTELYANIENIRFKNEIEFTLNIEKKLNLSTIKIPPLILQPFIENAIWHGLSAKKGAKKLTVSVSKKEENYIEILIVDNGIGRKKSFEIKDKKLHKKESVGLKLTEERLVTFSKKFNHKHKLFFTDLEENDVSKGTQVTIYLPVS